MKNIQLIIVLMGLFFATSSMAQDNEKYYMSKTLKGTVDEVTQKTLAALKEQGFGLITEVDMDAKLKEKMPEVEMKPYKILGVCNPGFAHQTLQVEENIGLFLPCKVLVKDLGNGNAEVVMINPSVMMGMLGKPELVDIADKVTEKFKIALENI